MLLLLLICFSCGGRQFVPYARDWFLFGEFGSLHTPPPCVVEVRGCRCNISQFCVGISVRAAVVPILWWRCWCISLAPWIMSASLLSHHWWCDRLQGSVRLLTVGNFIIGLPLPLEVQGPILRPPAISHDRWLRGCEMPFWPPGSNLEKPLDMLWYSQLSGPERNWAVQLKKWDFIVHCQTNEIFSTGQINLGDFVAWVKGCGCPLTAISVGDIGEATNEPHMVWLWLIHWWLCRIQQGEGGKWWRWHPYHSRYISGFLLGSGGYESIFQSSTTKETQVRFQREHSIVFEVWQSLFCPCVFSNSYKGLGFVGHIWFCSLGGGGR